MPRAKGKRRARARWRRLTQASVPVLHDIVSRDVDARK
jgi:hypothetical protein